MQGIEADKGKKTEQYVFISQVLFSLLSGILLVRVLQSGNVLSLLLYRNVILLAIPMMVLLIFKIIESYFSVNKKTLIEFGFNAIYLGFNLFLLSFENESFFRILLLMPVVVAALSEGTKKAYIWAGVVTAGIILINIMKKAPYLDVDILAISAFWLFAWLLGKMTETGFQIRAELQRQASVDGLTGVYNHRYFYSLLDKYFLKAKAAKQNLTLIMIDLDFFKYYNEAYGHQKGDVVLNSLANLLEQTVGNQGICARYGGDEFAIILPGSTGKQGVALGEKIRQAVEASEFAGMNILPKGHMTVSVGVASFPKHAETKEKLLRKADEALYKAKYTNANKVELYYSVFDEIEKMLQDKEKDMLNSMRTLLMVINAKDRYTYGHSERVMHYAMQIGKKMALWEWELQDLTVGALLHDIGKIELSREVLNKNGNLTTAEWELIRLHPSWGADMIRPVSSFGGVVDIILYHHENYNGSGYPEGKKGESIPVGARILRLADSFDAMTTNRPYKDTKPLSLAIKELKSLSGVFYDPEVVECFIEHINEIGMLNEEVS